MHKKQSMENRNRRQRSDAKQKKQSGSLKDDSQRIIGRNPVLEVLTERADEVERVMLSKTASGDVIDRIQGVARARKVPLKYVPAQRLDREVKTGNHQGVVAVVAPLAYKDLDEMLQTIAPTLDEVKAQKPLILMLDHVEDPYNYGAILRSATAGGVAGIIVPMKRMAPLSTLVIKASAGVAGKIPIARVPKLTEAIYQLKERGYWITGAAGEGDVRLWDLEKDKPLVLIVGSEGGGLDEEVKKACDYLVRIPMDNGVDSLNVSVAAALMIFQINQGKLL